MFLERLVFQAKYGKGGELVEAVKAFEPLGKRHGFGSTRVYTDVAGRFDTVIWEREFEDLGHWEKARGRLFEDPEFARWFQRLQPLVEHGSRELYRLEHGWS